MASGLVRKKWGVKAASKVKPYQVPRLAVGDDATGAPWLILPAQGWVRGPIAEHSKNICSDGCVPVGSNSERFSCAVNNRGVYYRGVYCNLHGPGIVSHLLKYLSSVPHRTRRGLVRCDVRMFNR